MSDTISTPDSTLVSSAMQSGAQKAGENVVAHTLDALVAFSKRQFGKASVHLGTAFQRYLDNATQRYNQIRTLATGPTPRAIIGPNNIYVCIGVKHQEKEYDTSTVNSMLGISNHLLIQGTGGAGKSMLMRYLFLNTANRGEYIPVLLELRRISNQVQGHVSILELVYTCMQEYDVQLPKEQFEYSLRLGKYLFLFDGLDEVKEDLAAEAAEALQAFSAKYPKNPCIITSRPKENISSLETYTIVTSMPLKKDQAILLASKIWEADEKTREFCHQLNESLYDKHQDFAENPLLLSMMFLTFMRNSSIPDHLADFYQKSYDALYSAHDGHDKGCYRRDFCCKSLDEGNFRLIFSHFCFHSYFKQTYEFSNSQIISLLKKSIEKVGIENTFPANYLTDLRNVVCMIVKDGDIYRFSHRSFQAYFAACYTAQVLSDEQQAKLFHSNLFGSKTYFEKQDYYELLMQIEPERFSVNALEIGLRKNIQDTDSGDVGYISILKKMYQGVRYDRKEDRLSFHISQLNKGVFNVFHLYHYYNGYVRKLSGWPLKADTNSYEIAEKLLQRLDDMKMTDFTHTFEEIDSTACFTNEERNVLYSALVAIERIPEICTSILNWLRGLDAKRASLERPDYIDDL